MVADRFNALEQLKMQQVEGIETMVTRIVKEKKTNARKFMNDLRARYLHLLGWGAWNLAKSDRVYLCRFETARSVGLAFEILVELVKTDGLKLLRIKKL